MVMPASFGAGGTSAVWRSEDEQQMQQDRHGVAHVRQQPAGQMCVSFHSQLILLCVVLLHAV